MHYTFDTNTQEVKAFSNLGDAARYVLKALNMPEGQNVVPQALQEAREGNRFALLNVSQAFASIAESDDEAAQELAKKFEVATNEFYS